VWGVFLCVCVGQGRGEGTWHHERMPRVLQVRRCVCVWVGWVGCCCVVPVQGTHFEGGRQVPAQLAGAAMVVCTII
jgi:hypothetical protein